jgi:protein SCO1/2
MTPVRCISACAVLLLAVGMATAQVPPGLEGVGIEQLLDQPLPADLEFVDDQGRSVRLADYQGERPVILVLAYYECPMLCTLVLNGLATSLDILKFDVAKDFEVVVVSIDPGETPELAAQKKANHVARYDREGSESGWHFLTGREESIRKLADSVGFTYRYDPDLDEYAHAAGIMVVTPDGKLSRYFYGVEFSPKDLRFALVEASQNRIGTVVDQMLLYCYRYDPDAATYSPVISRIVQVGGALTLIGVVSLIVGLRRWEARRLRGKTA